MVVAFTACFAAALVFRVQKFLTYPITTKMQVVHTSSVNLPAMTLCNINYIKKSYADQHPFIRDFLLAGNASPESTLNISDPKVSEAFNNISMRELSRNGSFTLDEMLYGCIWDGHRVKCSDIFQQVLTDLGYCFMFNSPEFIASKWRVNSTRTGKQFGLTIMANVSQDDYLLQRDYSAGLRVRFSSYIY
jgi:hypothetical protein